MNWILLALSSAFVFAIVTVMDKFLVSGYFSDGFVFSLFIRGFALVWALAIVLLTGTLTILPSSAMAWALSSGLVQVIAWGFYFKAIAQTNATWVAAFSQASPLVTAVLGVTVLGELLQPTNYLGIAMIVLGTFSLSLERSVTGERRWRFNSAVGLMIISVLAGGVVSLFIRIGVENEDPNNVFFWQQVGAAIGAVVLLGVWRTGRASLFTMLAPLGSRVYFASFGVEFLAAIGGVLTVAALATGPLGSVTALSNTLPVFVPLIAWVFNFIRPGSVPTEQKRTILPWWVAALIIVGGVYLVET